MPNSLGDVVDIFLRQTKYTFLKSVEGHLAFGLHKSSFYNLQLKDRAKNIADFIGWIHFLLIMICLIVFILHQKSWLVPLSVQSVISQEVGTSGSSVTYKTRIIYHIKYLRNTLFFTKLIDLFFSEASKYHTIHNL